MTEDITLYAVWSENHYSVVYNANHPDYNGTILTTDSTDGSFITLTGRWEPLTDYRVIYHPGMFGSLPAGMSAVAEGLKYADIVLLPTPKPSSGGYYFVGWSYNGAWVMPGTSYSSIAGNSRVKEIELVAMWKEVSVSGGGNGGGGSLKGPSAIPDTVPE